MVTTEMARTMLYVCVCLFASRIPASHVPSKMNKSIQNLLQYYIPVKERFNGRPVFSRELLATKLEAKGVLMAVALQTYKELIQRMLKELPAQTDSTSDIRAELSYILERVQKLRRFRFQEQEALLDGIERFRHIQLDSALIQSKALWELPWLYEEASSLADKQHRRQHKQAKRLKIISIRSKTH
uniref:interferon gamma-like isoform X2 n=1 Tax=Doryrhamphus excisus TaxID=161450 RepID=UPI0025ADE212|nr:interferon gamma-like isoform X2 [Doryrhamphus excisus]